MNIQQLLDESCTINEIAEELNLTFDEAKQKVEALHLDKLVYICSWERADESNELIPVYASGNEKDAKIPKPHRTKVQRDWSVKMLFGDSNVSPTEFDESGFGL